MPRALVIVPTYNERENLEGIVRRVLEAHERIDVLVVDDASPDGTGEAAEAIAAREPRARVLRRPAKLGLGTAYIAGFRVAIAEGYDSVFEFDADGSHPPERLPEMLRRLDEGATLVVGTRWMPGGRTENWPLRRRLLSRGAAVYARTLLRSRVRDITAGYRGYRTAFLARRDLDRIRSNGYSFQIEMSWLVERSDERIDEIPITFTERTEGSSKMSGAIIAEAVWRVAGWGLGILLADLRRPWLLPGRVVRRRAARTARKRAA